MSLIGQLYDIEAVFKSLGYLDVKRQGTIKTFDDEITYVPHTRF